MRIAHAADLHLDSPLRGLERYESAPVDELRGATRRAFENLVGACLEEDVRLLLLAGDLFDGDWKDWSTGLFFRQQLARLKEADVQVVLVRGNHDAASKLTRHLDPPSNVKELSVRKPETFVLESLGVAVHGQSFSSAEVTADLAAAYPAPIAGALNIGLLHTSLDGRPGHAPYAPTTLATLIDRGYEYWALGHVHQREVLNERPWVVFPGNLQGRHVRETGAKGATFLEADGGRITRVEHRSFDVARWARIALDVSDCQRLDDVLVRVEAALREERARADGRLLVARVVLSGRGEIDPLLRRGHEQLLHEVRALCTEQTAGAFAEKVLVQTQPALDLEALAREGGPVGALLRSLAALREDDGALLELGTELEELKRKLPPELRETEEGVAFDDPRLVREALVDVERELLPRLWAKESVSREQREQREARDARAVDE